MMATSLEPEVIPCYSLERRLSRSIARHAFPVKISASGIQRAMGVGGSMFLDVRYTTYWLSRVGLVQVKLHFDPQPALFLVVLCRHVSWPSFGDDQVIDWRQAISVTNIATMLL